jgi:chaperonin GroEL (HSP60 family)
MINALKTQYPDIQLNFYLGPCIRKNEYEVKEDVSIFFDKNALSFISNKIYLGLENVISLIIKENNYILTNDCEIGFNTSTDKFENLINAGVIDPVKVSVYAVIHAVSVAGMMLTTDVLVAMIKEDRDTMQKGN